MIVLIKTPHTNESDPIKIDTICWFIVNGTNLSALPPNYTINNWQIKIATTIIMKM